MKHFESDILNPKPQLRLVYTSDFKAQFRIKLAHLRE